MLKLLAKLLKVLNSETDPAQISLAACFGMVAGFTPLLSLHNLPVLLFVLILRVNLSAFLLSLAAFSALAFTLDPLFHKLGLAALTHPPLEGFWTSLYNMTLMRVERFNNSIVMGSLLVSLVLFIPLALVFNVLIRKYREHVLQWVRKTRIAEAIRASKFYGIYKQLSGWREGA